MKLFVVAALTTLLAGPAWTQEPPLPQRAADKACTCIGQQTVPDSALARMDKCLP